MTDRGLRTLLKSDSFRREHSRGWVPSTARSQSKRQEGRVSAPPWLRSAGLPLVYGSWVDAEHGGLQASGGVVEVWLFDPQQGYPVLPVRVLAGIAALEAHQQDGDDEDAKDGERVEEDEVEEGVIGADDGLQGGTWNREARP